VRTEEASKVSGADITITNFPYTYTEEQAQYAEPWRTADLAAPEDIVLLTDQGWYLAPA
jgi:hypothetical protein